MPVKTAPMTIAITTVNRPEFLRESIACAISQTIPVPVIVVDNGGLPEVEAVVREFPSDRIALVRNTSNLGMVGNWNQAIHLTPTRWMSILHDDDGVAPWFCDVALSFTNERISLVATRASYHQSALNSPRPNALSAAVYEPWRFGLKNITPFPGILFDRDLAISVGLFRPGLTISPDLLLWYRMACIRPALLLNHVAAFYRRHAKQDTFELQLRMFDLIFHSHDFILRRHLRSRYLRWILLRRILRTSARELYGPNGERMLRRIFRSKSAKLCDHIPKKLLMAWTKHALIPFAGRDLVPPRP
jgi:glycosyltransferase involved in cell wall biosynthesis